LGLGVLGGSLPLLLVVFALLSLASWFVLRRAVGVAPGQKKIWHKDIND
jgi:membrane protein implicated in regulation of membrane protease activity